MKPQLLPVAVLAALLAMPAMADQITVIDPYARASTAMSQSGAAFMLIENHGDRDDRLVAARSDIAERVELHTHREDADGIMRMIEVEEGFVVPAGGAHLLGRGGDHVMFLGLRQSLGHGDMVRLTLEFQLAGPLDLEVPVDMERAATHGAMQGHTHSHGH